MLSPPLAELDIHRCPRCLAVFGNSTVACICCGYSATAEDFSWTYTDGTCPRCRHSVRETRGSDLHVCPECGKSFYTTLSASVGKKVRINRWGFNKLQCPHCRAQIGRRGNKKSDAREALFCSVCKSPLLGSPGMSHTTCGHCHAHGRRFSCTGCGMPIWGWAKQDFDAWKIKCQFCGTEQLHQVRLICFACQHPVEPSAEAERVTCGNCGAVRLRLSCTACHEPVSIWGSESLDVWRFPCPVCGAAQEHHNVAPSIVKQP